MKSNRTARPHLILMTLSVLGSAGPLGPAAQATGRSDTSQSRWSHEALDALLAPVFINKMADCFVAGAGIAVVKDGQIAYMRGFGHGDVFAQDGVDPARTVFRIGSVTKTLTGVALLQLVDRGIVELDADVNRYLTGLEVGQEYPEPVRVRDLLTHTAGFDQLGYGRHASSKEGIVPLGEFLEDSLVRVRPPGILSCYDTYAVTLAGYLVEELSGLSFEEYLREHLFEPLRMERAGIRVPEQFADDFAVGYSFAGEWSPERWEYMNTAPASTVNATVADMARFMLMLLGEGAYEGTRVLSEASARAMLTRQHTNHELLPGFGFTFWEDTRAGLSGFSHGGSMTGFCCLLYLLPEEELGVFIACNQESSRLADSVLSILLGHYFADCGRNRSEPRPTLADVRLERFVGSYALNMYNHSRPQLGGWSMRPEQVSATGGHLKFRGRSARPVSPVVFEFPDQSLAVFREGRDGEITEMLIGQDVYERVSESEIELYKEAGRKRAVAVDRSILERYAGRYESPEGAVTIRVTEAGLEVDMPGHGTLAFKPSSDRTFFHEEFPVTLEFDAQDPESVARAMLFAGGDVVEIVRAPR